MPARTKSNMGDSIDGSLVAVELRWRITDETVGAQLRVPIGGLSAVMGKTKNKPGASSVDKTPTLKGLIYQHFGIVGLFPDPDKAFELPEDLRSQISGVLSLAIASQSLPLQGTATFVADKLAPFIAK
jgi:hypothetical protein